MGYIDPGIFGMITQIGYVLLFGLVSGLVFFFQPVKNLYNRLFKREQAGVAGQEHEDAIESQHLGA